MKLVFNNRWDQQGFHFYTKPISVFFNWWHNRGFGWTFELKFGRGAGYKRGRTFYVCWNARGGYHYKPKIGKLGFSFTRCGNSLPFSFGS